MVVITVLAIGKIIGAGATNVIPGEVTMAGTLRTMDEEWRAEVKELLKDKVNEIASEMNGKVEVKIIGGYPFLKNDDVATEAFMIGAKEYMGDEHVEEIPISMTAEDFSYYSHQVPACFYRLGIKNEAKGITSSVHNNTFNIDESAIETGMGLMAWSVLKELT